MEWTDTANNVLDEYLERMQSDLVAAGADPDEVSADLRRHIHEELAGLNLHIVTQQDVSRVLAKMGVPEKGASIESGSDPQSTPGPAGGKKCTGGKGASFGIAAATIFGVVLPIITLGFELISGICGSTFFDPIPTIWHALLVATVPAANAWAIFALTSGKYQLKVVGWVTGIAVGVSLYYAMVFLPITPIAVIGIVYFGIGLIPLAPLCSLITILRLRSRLRRNALSQGKGQLPNGWRPVLLVFVVILLLDLPQTVALIGTQMAVSPNESRQVAGIKVLRNLANRNVLLRSCYRANRPITDIVGFTVGLFGKKVSINERQNIYYRVTGVPFNAVKPPRMRGLIRGELINPDEWDFGQGGDQVSARVRGLELEQSRMDGIVDSDAGTVYTEWTLVFRNDSNSQREARAEILLPPGAVVSRLTLWVDGEEREAAYSGRAKVKAAYKRVVQRRRDPVLVTTSGPDQVLMQCFPVPPNGGTMKTRVGITSPLVLKRHDQGLMRLPCFTERNFNISGTLRHSVWIEAGLPLHSFTEAANLKAEQPQKNIFALRGELTAEELAGIFTILADRKEESKAAWARDPRDEGLIVRQVIEEEAVQAPERIVFVIDGSARMEEARAKMATGLRKLPDGIEFGVVLASDEVCELVDVRTVTRQGLEDAIKDVESVKFQGGCDNVPALIMAWDIAAEKPNSVIVWLHGTQPIQMQDTEALLQRWERRPGNPRLYDLQFGAGPNMIAKNLDGMRAVSRVPNLGNPGIALEDLLLAWRDHGTRLDYRRWREASGTTEESGKESSAHVARLWVHSEVLKLASSLQAGDQQKAVELATMYQLVTPVSGAVVLENAQQYEEAGLTPSSASDSPRVVPEPGTWILLVLGAVVILLSRRCQMFRSEEPVR
jgi:hypothetical protein